MKFRIFNRFEMQQTLTHNRPIDNILIININDPSERTLMPEIYKFKESDPAHTPFLCLSFTEDNLDEQIHELAHVINIYKEDLANENYVLFINCSSPTGNAISAAVVAAIQMYLYEAAPSIWDNLLYTPDYDIFNLLLGELYRG